MFASASLVALVLASPAWADPDYPAGLFERSPLNGPPAAVRGRNHADPLFQCRVRERLKLAEQMRAKGQPSRQ
jgi:hypothetical protein